ncbi:MAG: cache domain-containing protein [Lachnospiraceae bacterium]|nr:cache domain-containing protein [Lachnospiraceae bacterium]
MKADRNFWGKCITLFILIFLILSVNFYVLYSRVRDNAISGKQKEVMKAAMDFNYLLVESADAIKLISQTIEDMQREEASNKEILAFLEKESTIYGTTINKYFTGFYGYISGEYLDGVGWVPDDDFVPTERPWYIDACEAGGDVAFVSPYVDLQTESVTMSLSKMLPDREDVISMDITLDGMQRLVEEATIKNGWKYGMILDADGMVVAHSEVSELGKNYSSDEDGIGRKFSDKMSKKGTDYAIVKYGGKRYIALSADISNGWRTIAIIGAGDVLGSTGIMLIIFIIALLIIFSILVRFILKMRKQQINEAHLFRQKNSLANIYDVAFLINLKNNTYTEMADISPDIKMIIDEDDDKAQYTLRVILDAITDARYKRAVFDFINLSTLNERMGDKIVISKIFVSNKNEKYGIRFTPVERDENGELVSVIFMAENLVNE